MAESVDALVSNTSRFTPVPVRPRLWVLRGEKRKFLSFFCFLAWRRALCARVQCVCSLPSKLAITPPLPSKLRFILRHKFITSAAVLTLICGCANREVFIARPLGLRHIGVRASASHFDPALGTEDPRRTTSTGVSYFQKLKNGHYWSPHCKSNHFYLRLYFKCENLK